MGISTEDKVYEELKLLRQRLEDEAKTLALTISRFQLLSLIGLLLLCLLLVNEDFRPPKWRGAFERLQSWLVRNEISTAIRSVGFGHINNYRLKQSERRPLTESILNTGQASKIPLTENMTRVSKVLGDLYYGIDFLELEEVEKYLRLMEEQEGAVYLRDLAKYHYEGGLLERGTSLKKAFFSEYTLGSHRLLARRFPYDPEKKVSDYVSLVRQAISVIRKKHPQAAMAWGSMNDEWLEKYKLSDWTWGAWRHITDQMVSEWNSIVVDSIGAFDATTLGTLRREGTQVDWGSAIAWLQNELRRRAEEEKSIAAKATVWSITLDLPLKAVVLLFPLLWAAARCVLAASKLRQKLVFSQLDDIDGRIHRELGSHRQIIEQVRVSRPEFSIGDLVKREKWKTLFRSYPLIFTDIAYEIAAMSMVLYVVYRGMRLLLGEAGMVDRILFAAATVSGVALVSVFFMAARGATAWRRAGHKSSC